MRVELIKAYEDNTWDTEVFDIPDEFVQDKYGANYADDYHEVNIYRWIDKELRDATIYRNVVYWGIYNYSPEEE